MSETTYTIGAVYQDKDTGRQVSVYRADKADTAGARVYFRVICHKNGQIGRAGRILRTAFERRFREVGKEA